MCKVIEKSMLNFLLFGGETSLVISLILGYEFASQTNFSPVLLFNKVNFVIVIYGTENMTRFNNGRKVFLR